MATSRGNDEGRMKSYKTKGLNPEDLRKKREEEEIQLRRNRRDEEFTKRRNISQSIENPFHTYHTPFQDMPLEMIVKKVYSPDVSEQLKSIQHLRILLSVENVVPTNAISQVINTGILPRIIENLNLDAPVDIQSAWIITNVASGSHYQTRTLIDLGVVPKLIMLMQSPHNNIREQVVWALGNIAGDSYECRDIVLAYGAMDLLLHMLIDSNITLSLKSQCAWTLSNFCRGKDPTPNDEIIWKSLPVLAQLIYNDEISILSDCCWTLSFLCEGSNHRIQRVINSGVVRRLVELLMHPDIDVLSPALRAIGNILTGDDPQTQVVINCSALPAIQHLLDHPVSSVRKESCWAVSNTTAGNKVQIQAVIDCNIVPKLLNIMDTSEFKIRKEAAWAILNITAGGTPYQIRYLVNVGALSKLCDLLTINDPRILLVTLEGLENILKVGQDAQPSKGRGSLENPFVQIIEEANGVEKLESLQNHSQPKIYLLASKLIDRYFTYSDIIESDFM